MVRMFCLYHSFAGNDPSHSILQKLPAKGKYKVIQVLANAAGTNGVKKHMVG
jgi:hypothetical protein